MAGSTTIRERSFVQTVILSFVFFVFFASGCNGPKKPDGMPKIYPVQIIVNQEGKPLAEAAVTLFHNDPELTRWVPAGTTNASGKVLPRTSGQFEGVPEGAWKVLVTKRVTEYSEKLVDPNMPEMGKKVTAVYDSVEPQYNDRAGTPLTVDVKPGSNSFTLDAGKAVHIPVKRLDR